MQLFDVASQTLPPNGPQIQSSGGTREHFRENQVENGVVRFLDSSNSFQNDDQETDNHILTSLTGGNNIPSLKMKTPHIEERLVIGEQGNDFYLSLSSTAVLRSKNENYMWLRISKMAQK